MGLAVFRSRTMQTLPVSTPWLKRAARFVCDLHHGVVPLDETLHRPSIDALIPSLRDRSCRSTNQNERFLLRTLELRAKGLRERWRAKNQPQGR